MSPGAVRLAVTQKLVEINPGFGGMTRHKVENGQVVSFGCEDSNVADIGRSEPCNISSN